MGLSIGPYHFELGLFSSPLAGISKAAQRILSMRYGCELTFTEMIKAKGLNRGGRSRQLLTKLPQEHYVMGCQLAEGDPAEAAEAARLVESQGFEIVDLNFGCPSSRIMKCGAGAGGLKDPARCQAVMAAVVDAVSIPVTAKFRLGDTRQHVVGIEVAQRAEQAGVQAITVHGRTADMNYGDPVDYDMIAQIKQSIKIPLIGNGDVKDGPSARAMMERTGCDGVMVGRASMGHPWVFHQIAHYLRTGQECQRPPFEDVLPVMVEHHRLLNETEGEMVANLQMRKMGSWYMKGYAPKRLVHENLFKIKSNQDFSELVGILESYQNTSLSA